MKRIFIYAGIGISLLVLCSTCAVHNWIGRAVKDNISIAQEKYPGTPEDALISFLRDETNSAHNRTHVAIWTLGQLQSDIALPILYEYNKDDPEGKTCFGNHGSLLCQYEIHKAIDAIERGRLFSHVGLK